jgi:hypothetical protein
MRQQQYKIVEAVITSERLGDRKVDVRPSIVELVLFENLEKPYVSGQIAILDNEAIFDAINFKGTERLTLGIASELGTNREDGLRERTFIMTSIETAVKTGDNGNSGMYVFTLIDEHAFLSKTKKISRSVRGSLEQEILKICATELHKDIDVSYLYEGGNLNEQSKVSSVQNEFKAIIPYLHPLEACEWLRDRATTQTGCPFFLYASMHDENLRLGNLEVMLKQKPFNEKVPYTFSPSNVQLSESGSFNQQQFLIQTMRAAKLQNSMQQLMTGGVGSLYNNTNTQTGRISSTHFSVTNLLQNLRSSGIIPENKEQNVYDQNFVIGENELHLDETNARVFHTVTSTGTYDNYKSYHDEYDIEKFKKKLENLSVRNMLYKNMYEVTVPGAGFIISKASVGDIIRINVISDNTNNDKSSEKFDRLRSGDFLIYSARHTFKDTRHDVAMSVCKLTRG